MGLWGIWGNRGHLCHVCYRGTSQDITLAEGNDVILSCKAEGYPQPRVKWRREDGRKIREPEGENSKKIFFLIALNVEKVYNMQ